MRDHAWLLLLLASLGRREKEKTILPLFLFFFLFSCILALHSARSPERSCELCCCPGSAYSYRLPTAPHSNPRFSCSARPLHWTCHALRASSFRPSPHLLHHQHLFHTIYVLASSLLPQSSLQVQPSSPLFSWIPSTVRFSIIATFHLDFYSHQSTNKSISVQPTFSIQIRRCRSSSGLSTHSCSHIRRFDPLSLRSPSSHSSTPRQWAHCNNWWELDLGYLSSIIDRSAIHFALSSSLQHRHARRPVHQPRQTSDPVRCPVILDYFSSASPPSPTNSFVFDLQP